MAEDTRREAERLLARLRPEWEAPSLGHLFPDTPGMPVPLEDWIAQTDPDKQEGPRSTRDG